MADWNSPVITTDYEDVLAELKARDEDLAKMFASGGPTNLPTGTIKWDPSAKTWKKWNGSSWEDASDVYVLPALQTTGNAQVGGTLSVTGAGSFGGAVTLPGNPSNNLHAAPKQYVDNNFQSKHAILTALAALNSVPANRIIYSNGTNSFTVSAITSFALSILDDANAAAVRSTIGAGTGTVSRQSSNFGSGTGHFFLTDGTVRLCFNWKILSVSGSGNTTGAGTWDQEFPNTCYFACGGIQVWSGGNDRVEFGVQSFSKTGFTYRADNASNVSTAWVLGIGN